MKGNGDKNGWSQRGSSEAGFLIGLVLLVLGFAAWFTHIVVCLSEEVWGFLIAGAIMFPIAVIHGVGIWFGVW